MSNDWLKKQFQRADSPNDDSTNVGSETQNSYSSTNYINQLSESQIRKLISNYENEDFETISKCLVVLRDNYFSSIGSGVLDSITKHFGKSNSEEMFISNGSNEPFYNNEKNNKDYGNRTEDKFDNDIIPTTKTIGIIGSILSGLLMFFNGSWFGGLLYAIVGIMATLGLCVLLEGISTIIKLLRKISEK